MKKPTKKRTDRKSTNHAEAFAEVRVSTLEKVVAGETCVEWEMGDGG